MTIAERKKALADCGINDFVAVGDEEMAFPPSERVIRIFIDGEERLFKRQWYYNPGEKNIEVWVRMS
jgi:transposase